MKIIYLSLTGNCKKFLSYTNVKLENIMSITDLEIVDFPFILVTPTIGFGDIPLKVKEFMDKNSRYAVGVVASGNRNWGSNFAASADKINASYGTPILMKFELLGNNRDVDKFNEIYEEISNARI
ncbi:MULTISPECIES: class Ib ribonucleoside-diphosphate reductase assembly flavoprotein NrdI [unclassified Gemella]|uniref:class Ib ribonucleoside-diphosphate reductase assembly flavoprotein NrdI n=1 Tax=unclassified Gemella TaxID=2624949 RepID=UPI001074423A|nr:MULTISPECIES: class Ib ribonucleoside-diphosphate reductase assembly flavoprotein NrdI [unclassified Gemella]MBF0710399.1 class Ib ribonucleoside-diphosphate reductase assembly flavoprotein NrdI [Gemella sp. GL1.1]MBF0747037.1 class Ib ribonucleoside-diphosphate reductase assembly flavoprotein NrdI [Gemella sp. 19428wG2_WT2a]NYS27743.1 class Ib ribonucleoside-diphosphate reductase assembly flavoprotein NrdI [Gemella sp. GL1]TFU58530.1 class Ib ribonucleoside-diphosphate reductase assembly fl